MKTEDRKRLMILGGSQHQLQLIHTSKNLGYYTIVCDMRFDIEGVKIADKHIPINYMNYDDVIKAAKECKIDGILSNSEPAMLNVARLSQDLGLVGNSVGSIEKLISKTQFRVLQEQAKVYHPESHSVSTFDELLNIIKVMNYPLIIKPMESSGTRGITKINEFNYNQLLEAYNLSYEFSRNNKVTIEEFVEMTSLRFNNAELLVIGDDLIWDGTLWNDRSPDMPLLPMTKILPLNVTHNDLELIKDTVNRIIKTAGIKHGEYNIETYFTKNHEVFVVEINPRQGGDNIPRLIKEHTGVDLTKLLVSTAVGDMSYYETLKNFKRSRNVITCHNVFAKKSGLYQGLHIDKALEKYVTWIIEEHKVGEQVVKTMNAGDILAYVTMQYDSIETQHRYLPDIENLIYAKIK